MRISDWSSDVCSSDLIQPSGSQIIFHGNTRFHDEWNMSALILEEIQVLQRIAVYHQQIGMSSWNDLSQQALLAQDARIRDSGGSYYFCWAEHVARSEERRVGKECVRTGRFRWSRYN